MFAEYQAHVKERAELGIPPLSLTPKFTEHICDLLLSEQLNTDELLDLFVNRVAPGVDPAAKVKAKFLGEIAQGKRSSPNISKARACEILGTMIGGYNVTELVALLSVPDVADFAATALSQITLVYDGFAQIVELSKVNAAAKRVVESWAKGEWFSSRAEMETIIKVKVFKVPGETNTDDLSPAKDAPSRPDIPLHSLAMGVDRFPGGIETIAKFREEGYSVAFVGDVVGTGSSRKSACNSVLWHIGEDIPYVPNKRRRGVIIGSKIAPIFFNTAEDSGGFPIECDVSKMNTGDVITINTATGEIHNEAGELIATFAIKPSTLKDEYRAGGRIPLLIGRDVTMRARQFLGMEESTMFTKPSNPVPKADQGYTLAQKIVGRACGMPGVLPGSSVVPIATTVLSQDTTGPMTADELTELACVEFQSPLFMQSFCHTAAYPKPKDVRMHESLPKFISDRKGVALRPGDGVCHSWVNRMLLPDTFGTGGDSHTRFPIGISFPAGSGLVAFAGAMGFMPLDMPESVLVRFSGSLRPGMTLRDAVNAIPYYAIKKGLLTVPKENKKNCFNQRILEIEGLPNLTVEQAFELTDASAERSAAACAIQLSLDSVVRYCRSNVAMLRSMVDAGYSHAETIENRIKAIEEWLANPSLLEADSNAEYAEVIEINLDDITEPIVACPNDPDDVKLLSDVAGTSVEDVFIGSCMTNIGHFRAAGRIWDQQGGCDRCRTFVCPPTRMDQARLKEEGVFSQFNSIGARIEIPGCSLCMGNQLRVPDGDTVFSTSTRNFNNRMGQGAQVFLGSAELAAVVALKRKMPTPEEYLAEFQRAVAPHAAEVYDYLQFDEEDPDVEHVYGRRDI